MSSETTRPGLSGYVFAALLIAAATGFSWGVPAIALSIPYAPFFVAAVVAAARFGLVPGLLAAGAGALAAQYVISAHGGAPSLITLLEFVMTSGVAVWALAARRGRRDEIPHPGPLAEMEALRRENQELNAARRSASHQLVQSLGAITNYAEVIRGHSSGTVRDSAASIIDVAFRTAASIRQQLDGAPSQTPEKPVDSATAGSTPAGPAGGVSTAKSDASLARIC